MKNPRPPAKKIIQAAVDAANSSPCAKSKRGVVSFYKEGNASIILSVGYNRAPDNSCDGSEECRRDCNKRCTHAETVAILDTINTNEGYPITAQLLHVKTVDGLLVAGGPPSCWQCSKLALEAGFSKFWLYEETETSPYGEWKCYSIRDFNDITMKNCGIYQIKS